MCTRAFWTLLLGLASLVEAQNSGPRVMAVVNAASRAAGAQAPGALVLVEGVGLMGPVRFDELEAAVLETREEGLLVRVPVELAGRASVAVRVGAETFELRLTPSAPGVFAVESTGRRAEALSFEATGFDPGAELTVLIGGRRATVAALGEGRLPGVWRVTVLVPPALEYGGRLPLWLEAGGVRSQLECLAEIEGPPAPKPALPARLLAYAAGLGVRLSWAPGDAQAYRYRVERRIGNQARELAVVTAAGWSDSETTLAAQPQYRLRAETDYGWSDYTPWSAAVAEPVAPAPLAPALRVAGTTSRSVRLAWTPGGGQRFRVERRPRAGTFTPVANPAVADYQDAGVTPATAYGYRVRAESADGAVISAWSAEAEVSTPPAAPALQGALMTGNAVRLTWQLPEDGTKRWRLEWRVGNGDYGDKGVYGPTQIAVRLEGLNAGTSYAFRLRAESDAGLSDYSNEVFLLTPAAAPASPSNLRGVPASTSEIELTWTNNAAEATAIRVEMRPAGGSFSELASTAAELVRTRVTALAPNTEYGFRVRAEGPNGLSVYSNEISVRTLASTQPRTIFLIHGLDQDSSDLARLKSALGGPSGVDPARFSIEATFDWSSCAAASCPANCSLSETADRLAAHILVKAPGDVVLVALGAGGLVAREMIANNRGSVLTLRRLAGLVTLGAPNLGYPFASADEAAGCPQLLRDLRGDFRPQQQNGRTELSPYLETLFGNWAQRQFPGASSKWLAVSGRSCSEPVRRSGGAAGCRDRNPESDGSVCDDSAVYSVATRNGSSPTQTWRDPQRQYSRADGLAPSLCPADARTLPLSDPPVGSALFEEIRRFINAL